MVGVSFSVRLDALGAARVATQATLPDGGRAREEEKRVPVS